MSIDSEPKTTGELDNDTPRFPVIEAEEWPVIEAPSEHQTLHGVEPWDQGLEISGGHKILELGDGSVLRAVIKADGLELAVVDRGESTPPDEPRYAFMTKDYAGGDNGIYAVETDAPQLLGRHNLGIDTKPPGSREERGLFAFQILGNGQLHVLAHDKASGKIEVLWGMSSQEQLGKEAVEGAPVELDLAFVHEAGASSTLLAEEVEAASSSQEIQKEPVWAEVFTNSDTLQQALQSPETFNLGPDEQQKLQMLAKAWRETRIDASLREVWETKIAPQFSKIESGVKNAFGQLQRLDATLEQMNTLLANAAYAGHPTDTAGQLKSAYSDTLSLTNYINIYKSDVQAAVGITGTDEIRDAIRAQTDRLSDEEARQLCADVYPRVKAGEDMDVILGELQRKAPLDAKTQWQRFSRNDIGDILALAGGVDQLDFGQESITAQGINNMIHDLAQAYEQDGYVDEDSIVAIKNMIADAREKIEPVKSRFKSIADKIEWSKNLSKGV